MDTYLFLFCVDPEVDPVAPQLLKLARDRYRAVEKPDSTVGGWAVSEAYPVFETRYVFVPTRSIASYEHLRIADDLNRLFPDARLISVVNWHEGANAPGRIFCAHTVSDVPQAFFPPASAVLLSAVLRAVERARRSKGLDQWRTLVEASHWSGTMAGRPLSELLLIKAPVIDLEIGSYPEDWADTSAHEVLVEALGLISASIQDDFPSILFFGGPHFEPTLSEVLLMQESPLNIGPVLPNQWLVQGRYENNSGIEKVSEAVRSVLEPVAGLCFHDNLKSCYKTAIKEAGGLIGVPVFNHRKLRDAAFLGNLMKGGVK